MLDSKQFEEFQAIYPEAKEISEAGYDFVYMPKLILPNGCQPPEVEGLLCPQLRDGYATRLFLSAQVIGKGINWTQHHIVGKTWHSWSWQNVQANQRLVQILLGHLGAFR